MVLNDPGPKRNEICKVAMEFLGQQHKLDELLNLRKILFACHWEYLTVGALFGGPKGTILEAVETTTAAFGCYHEESP